MEQKFLQIIEKYNQLKNIDYISSNILNIENEIFGWKNNIGELKKFKISEDMSSKIREIELDIMKKQDIIQIYLRHMIQLCLEKIIVLKIPDKI